MAQSRSSNRPSRNPRPTRTTAASGSGTIQRSTELLGFIPERFRTVTWCLLLLLSLLIFFSGPIFNGEYFNALDNISWESYRPYLEQMADEGQSPQWMPYIFSGM